MKRTNVVVTLAIVLATLSWDGLAGAQSMPTAEQPMQLSAFGAASGVYTNLANGHNISFTAGVDLALLAHHGIRPVLEVRGTYPINGGTVDAQKSAEGGLKVEFLAGHRLRPYGDFLFGRGETNYENGGYLYNSYRYDLTTTNIYSPGGGLDYDINQHFSLKGDVQVQRWSSAPTNSGLLYSDVASVGLVYRFDFNHGRGVR